MKPEANGLIDAEDFGNFDYPALLVTFGKAGSYEVTGANVRADGKRFSASKVITVE